MPTYDYHCTACGHRFEKFQSMSAKTLRKCPECKKTRLERLIGAGAGVIFRGSGFYGTDYRDSSYSADAKKDSDSKDSTATDSGPGDACQPSCGTDAAPSDCQRKPDTKSD